MSVLKHSALLLTLWACVIAYYLYHPMPEDIEDPWKVRMLLGAIKVTAHMSIAASKLGLSTEQEAFRWILNRISVAQMKIHDPDLNIKTTDIEGIRVRFYEPVNAKPYGPAIVYFHGGGWTVMSIDTHDKFTRELAKRTQVTVISVDYRLAPENPYPAPFDDCYAVTRHLLEFGSQFKIDPSKIVIMGESAGGNLAAAVAQKMRSETKLPKIHRQILIHAALQAFDFQLPSYINTLERPIITSQTGLAAVYLAYMGKESNFIRYLTKNNHTTKAVKDQHAYLVNYRNLPAKFQEGFVADSITDGDHAVSDAIQHFILDPYFSPLMQKNLAGLPPAYVSAAFHDCLRDEAFLYADRLRKAGVPVEFYYDKLGFHGDVFLWTISKSGERGFSDVVRFVKKLFPKSI